MLADPSRLHMLQHLSWGDCSVAQLVVATGLSQSNVSNHLRRLRSHGLVETEKRGRVMIYRLASPAIAEVIAALFWAAMDDHCLVPQPTPPSLHDARTCYDHLAGAFGVRLLQGLVAHQAVSQPEHAWEEIVLASNAANVFERLGLDLSLLSASHPQRRFAFACADWSESGKFHLGGYLGTLLCHHLLAQKWVVQQDDRRVEVTLEGQAALAWIVKN